LLASKRAFLLGGGWLEANAITVMSIMDELPTAIINLKPVTGSKKYYGVTSKKSAWA